ncbi:unnamed protein product [Rotaria magnacalcarata]
MNVIKNRLLPSLITIPLLNNTFQNDSSTTQPSFKHHKYNIYLNSNNTFVNRYSRNNFQSSFRTPAFSHNQSRLSTANTVFSLDSSDKTELEPGESPQQLKILINTGAKTTSISDDVLQNMTYLQYTRKACYSLTLADGLAPFHVLGVVEVSFRIRNSTTKIHVHIAQKPPWLSGYVVRHVFTRYCVQTSVAPSME